MAEVFVGVLIGRLGAALAKEAAAYGASLLCNETSALRVLFGEIRKAKQELESMKTYLRQSEKVKGTNQNSGNFINTVWDLSFGMENVVDEFMYKLEDHKHGGFAAKMKKRIKHLKVWHRLAHKLRDINAELEDAAKRRDRFVIPGMQGQAGRSEYHARSTNQTLCFAREDDLVGIEDNATKLKEWLVGDLEENKYKTATVWGMPGVGKTTMVDHVYKSVKLDFDDAAWVTVSQSYQVWDLLKRIAKEFGIKTDATDMEIRKLVESIRRHLEGKRCILVLDDVWEKDVINDAMEVFPTNCIIRIVLTSRNIGVAPSATPNCTIKLEPLGDNHSWELFCRAAFQNSDDKSCPSELQNLAVKFLQRCEGLPIAIACMGRLLSFKQPTFSEWDSMYTELELQSNNEVIKGVDSILKLSLEDLPYELKNCFLHCEMFPDDHELTRRTLMRHWISSGFIKEKDNKTLEQVGEDYLNDLVNRSLLQVVMKNEFGRLKRCRMHEVIRKLAIEKAKEERFGIFYKGDGNFLEHVNKTRRLSILSTNNNVPPQDQNNATNLHAIYGFTSSVDIDLLRSIFASSRLLSSLDLQGTEIKMLPNDVFKLFNLRFLGLRDTRIEMLPEDIGRLQNLEVLDTAHNCLLSLPKAVAKLIKLRYLYALSLPKAVAKLIKLRYLYATVEVTGGRFRFTHRAGVKVPKGIRNLTGLHVLQNVKASSETLCDVVALTELRKFGVDDVTSEHSLSLHSALLNMSNLVTLVIHMSNENEVLPLQGLRLPETISTLALGGKLEKKQTWLHLNNLSRLQLTFSKLDENSFPSLMELRNLCSLELFKAYDGNALCFPAQSFPRLRKLEILDAPQLSRVEIEKGALGSLVKLYFSGCPELKHLPHGIEYLSMLDKLYWEDVADELTKILSLEGEANECNEVMMKICHIRRVLFSATGENFWRRVITTEGNAFAG